MAVDLLEQDRVNIKDVVLPEPKQGVSGLPFNPDRDITARDQAEIEKHLGEQMNEMLKLQRLEGLLPSTTHFFEYYLATKTLCPQITERLPFDEQMRSAVNNRLQRSRAQRLPEYFHLAALVKAIFPEQQIQGLEKMSGDELNFSRWYFTGQLQTYLRYIWDSKILFPPGFSKSQLNEDGWSEIKNHLESLEEWADVTEDAALLRMSFPEYYPTLQTEVSELQISDQRWDMLRRDLIDSHRKSGSWEQFTTNAFNLTILAAEDVQITDKGLEITIPRPLITESKPNLPQRRKF